MLEDIDTTLKKQKIDLNNNYNFDLVNYYYDNNYLSIEIFFIRDGLLFGRHNEIISSLGDITNEVVEYLIKFYEKSLLPKELLVPMDIDKELLSNYFNIKVNTPERGKLKSLLDLAKENAKEQIRFKRRNFKKDDDERLKAIRRIKRIIRIKNSVEWNHLIILIYLVLSM